MLLCSKAAISSAGGAPNRGKGDAHLCVQEAELMTSMRTDQLDCSVWPPEWRTWNGTRTVYSHYNMNYSCSLSHMSE